MAQELPIEYGGTGADNAADALNNIGGLPLVDAFAPNKIKMSQLVVVGVDGNPLPSPVPLNVPIGEEVAFGWKALTAVTNLITDANGNVKLTNVAVDTGTIYYDIDLADNNTPVLATLFGSIMRCTDKATGTYVQIFESDSTALTISNPTATTARFAIDLVDLEDGFKIAGLSDFRGRLEVLSTKSIIEIVTPRLILDRTMQNVTLSRFTGVEYTNTDVCPIEIYISGRTSDPDSQILYNGAKLYSIGEQGTVAGSLWTPISFTVNPGHTYEVEGGGLIIDAWSELRRFEL